MITTNFNLTRYKNVCAVMDTFGPEFTATFNVFQTFYLFSYFILISIRIHPHRRSIATVRLENGKEQLQTQVKIMTFANEFMSSIYMELKIDQFTQVTRKILTNSIQIKQVYSLRAMDLKNILQLSVPQFLSFILSWFLFRAIVSLFFVKLADLLM